MLEKKPCNGDRAFLSSEEGESDLTESEAHLNMMKGGGSTLQALLHPPSAPSEHSSSVVNMAVGFLGRCSAPPAPPTASMEWIK